MNETPVVLFTLFGFPIYAYGAALATSIGLGLLLCHRCFKRSFSNPPQADALALWVIPAALLGARVVYCLARLDGIIADLSGSFVYKLWLGGYSIVGALLGGVLGAWFFARRKRLALMKLLDAAAPGALLVIALCRGAECFTAQGLGDLVENPALCFFPFGVADMYGDFYIPVFFWEGLAALGIMLWALHRIRQGRAQETASLALLLLCACQVFLESLREDDSLRFGFVRFNQLASVVGILGVMLLLAHSRKTPRPVLAKRLIGFFLLVLLMIGIEFALDKTPWNHVLLYGVMIAALCGCVALTSGLPKADQSSAA